jgi:hypothetical protein
MQTEVMIGLLEAQIPHHKTESPYKKAPADVPKLIGENPPEQNIF